MSALPDLRARTRDLLAARIHCLLTQLPLVDPAQGVRAERSFSVRPVGDTIWVTVGVQLTGFDGADRPADRWVEGLYDVVAAALRSWGHEVLVVGEPSVTRLEVSLP